MMEALLSIIQSLWSNAQEPHNRQRECRLIVVTDFLTARVQPPAKSARPGAEDNGRCKPNFQLVRLNSMVMTTSEVSSRMAAGERSVIEFAMMV